MARWLLGCLVVAACVLGCGGTEDGIEIGVVVWKPNDPAAWDLALEVFHEQNPDIRVRLEIGPNNSSQLHALLSQKLRSRDRSVDAFLMDVVWTPQFARAGWVTALDEQFPPAARAAFFDGCVAADTYDGHVWAVPFNTDGGILYYRKDLLQKHGLSPPTTWPALMAQVATIRGAEGDTALHGYSGQMKQYEGLVCNLLELVESNGGRIDEPDTSWIEALRFARDEIVGAAAPRGILTWEEQDSLDLFASGGAVFHRNWPYAWAILQQSDLAGNVGIAVLPAFEGGQSVSTLGGWRFGISAHARHPDAAWTFVEFMTSEAMQRHFAVEAGKAPARRTLYTDDAVLAANPHFADLAPVFETATPRPRSPVYPQLSNTLQRHLHAALSNPDSDLEGIAAETKRHLKAARARVRDR